MVFVLRCQSCGAPHDLVEQYTKVLACQYCGAISKVEGSTLTIVGQSTKLNLGNSLFKLGDQGKILDKEFRVLGRVRYHHEVGVWDEWHLLLDSQTEAWLQHDEGELVLFTEEKPLESAPDLSQLHAGIKVDIDNKELFISEIGEAVVAGLSGQISRDLSIGQGFFYVDGITQELALSLEYYFREVWLSLGKSVPIKNLQIF
jgi:hypothetical protein